MTSRMYPLNLLLYLLLTHVLHTPTDISIAICTYLLYLLMYLLYVLYADLLYLLLCSTYYLLLHVQTAVLM